MEGLAMVTDGWGLDVTTQQQQQGGTAGGGEGRGGGIAAGQLLNTQMRSYRAKYGLI